MSNKKHVIYRADKNNIIDISPNTNKDIFTFGKNGIITITAPDNTCVLLVIDNSGSKLILDNSKNIIDIKDKYESEKTLIKSRYNMGIFLLAFMLIVMFYLYSKG